MVLCGAGGVTKDLEEVTNSSLVTLELGGSGERTPWLTVTLALTPWASAVGSSHPASLLLCEASFHELSECTGRAGLWCLQGLVDCGEQFLTLDWLWG